MSGLEDYNTYRVKGYQGGRVTVSTIVAAQTQVQAIRCAEQHYSQFFGMYFAALQLKPVVRVAVDD